MALTVRDLIDRHIFPGLKLLAGHQGGKNEIRWVNLMEILDTPQSVSPSELLFTTGYGIQDSGLYGQLIPQLAARGVSGLVIQPGYYVDQIPAYILTQADQYSFPVMTIPKGVTFSNILHTMMRLISQDYRQEWSEGSKQQVCLFIDRALKACEKNPFPPEEENAPSHSDSQCVHLLLLEPMNYSFANWERWTESLNQVNSFLQSHNPYCTSEDLPHNRHVYLTVNTIHDHLSMFHELNTRFTLLSEHFGTNWYLGADQLRNSKDREGVLDRTMEALNTLRFVQAERGTCSYKDIDFLKALGYMHQTNHSAVLSNQPLQLLLNYDRTNNTGYVETLRVYLANSCNVTQTAKRLFIHRHTLLKRLDKIREIGGFNLDDHYARIYMAINLLFHDYFVY